MAFTLYALLQAALLFVNAIAVLHEERFLRRIGWGADQGIGGFGEDPGIKGQLMNLIRSVRTVMRGTLDPASKILGQRSRVLKFKAPEGLEFENHCPVHRSKHFTFPVPLIGVNTVTIVLLLLFG